MNVDCDECGGHVAIPSDAMSGEIVSCKDCGSEFEVVIGRQGTIELKSAEKVGEDWGE